MSVWTDGQGKVHLSCAETAKLVRKALKAAFPGQKFSVRSDTYAGGASVNVSWTDGPTGNAVDEVVGVFSGKRFDGMIDMACYYDHWLMPDGSVQIAHTSGTTGSKGYVEPITTDPPSPNARLCSLGADYIQTQRRLSAEVEAQIKNEIAEFVGEPVTDGTLKVRTFRNDDGTVFLSHDETGSEYVNTLVWQIGCMRSYA